MPAEVLFGDPIRGGDGIMKSTGKKLSELKQCWTRFPQLVTNIRVREKRPFDQLDGVNDLIAQAESAVKSDGGRVLLRYSGTEPKARLLIEGRESAVLEHWSEKISTALKTHIGA